MNDPRVAYRKDGQLKHSPQCRMTFGRLDPPNCARCDQRQTERAEGVPARVHEGFEAMRRQQEHDAARAVEIREHFASELHRSGGCGACCTFGDW